MSTIKYFIEERASQWCMGIERRIVSESGKGPWVCGKMAEVWREYKRMRRKQEADRNSDK